MPSISSVQGLSSGIQWQDLVDQLIAVDSSRQLDPLTRLLAGNQSKTGAWTSYRNMAQALADAAAGLKDGTAFGAATVSGGTSASTGRALVSATATTDAQPGQYQVEVLSLAQSEKIGGNAVASATTALGFSGDFTVNGQKVSVSAGSSLTAIRTAINAVSNSSHVTATLLGTAGGGSRLVLTSDVAGAKGIELVDSSAGGVLQQLGLVDGSYSFSTDENGHSTGATFKSTNTAVATALGITAPAATSIRVGNVTISVDLSNDTLSDIATRLQAAGVDANVAPNTESGATTYRLVVGGNVSAIPDTVTPSQPDANSLRALELLGFAHAGRAAISQVVASGPLAAADDSPAIGSTLLSDLKSSGTSANMQVGDTISLSGRRGDGTAVTVSFTVGATSTLNDLLGTLNGVTGFGGGTRSATASLGVDGSIQLTDNTSGDSQLAFSLSVSKSVANGGGSTGIGAFHVGTTGRQREIISGTDAQIRVDGVQYSRTSNTITDAIAGVSLKLQQTEVGTQTTLNVARDTAAAVTSMQAFVKAFNDTVGFVNKNTASRGLLASNGSLRSSGRALSTAMLTDITGGSFSRATLIGISLDKTGVLTLDAAAFTTALKSDENGVKQLFGLNGSTDNAALEYVGASDNTAAGTYAVNVTALATNPTVTGTGATFPFNDGGVPRTMNFTDGVTGKTGSIVLATGDDASAISSKLNAMFTSNGMLVNASVVSGALTITGPQFGSNSSFTVAYGVGDTTSAGQVGIAAQQYAGTDIAGTIDGVAATGLGQVLTANTGATASGLIVRYSGLVTGAVGSTTVVVGTGALISRIARSVTRSGDGLVDSVTTQLDLSSQSIQRRSDDVSARLLRRKNALLKQFAAMEAAVQRVNAQSSQITSMISSLQTQNK